MSGPPNTCLRSDPIHIVFSGGGTAGHLFPGLAAAEQLSASVVSRRITFCGGGKPFERRVVAAADFEYLSLPVRPWPRRSREAIGCLVHNIAGYLAASEFLRREKVAVVVGLGGYASFPMGLAAIRHGVPLVLLEQNVVPGKVTRWLARRASLVCAAYEESLARLRCECPVRVTGNPIRRDFLRKRDSEVAYPRHSPAVAVVSAGFTDFLTVEEFHGPVGFSNRLPSRVGGVFAALAAAEPLAAVSFPDAAPCPSASHGSRQLLVLGGSGGARSLNENVPRALYKVRSLLSGWKIVHQTGEAGAANTQALYRKLGLTASVTPFIEDMAATLGATDLAICRAGGTTLAELAAMRVPAVLMPFPRAADDHQRANAQLYAARGGCVLIDEREVSGPLDNHLADMLCFLLANPQLLGRMALAMHRMAAPHAAEHAAELIWSIASSRSRVREAALASVAEIH